MGPSGAFSYLLATTDGLVPPFGAPVRRVLDFVSVKPWFQPLVSAPLCRFLSCRVFLLRILTRLLEVYQPVGHPLVTRRHPLPRPASLSSPWAYPLVCFYAEPPIPPLLSLGRWLDVPGSHRAYRAFGGVRPLCYVVCICFLYVETTCLYSDRWRAATRLTPQERL